LTSSVSACPSPLESPASGPHGASEVCMFLTQAHRPSAIGRTKAKTCRQWPKRHKRDALRLADPSQTQGGGWRASLQFGWCKTVAGPPTGRTTCTHAPPPCCNDQTFACGVQLPARTAAVAATQSSRLRQRCVIASASVAVHSCAACAPSLPDRRNRSGTRKRGRSRSGCHCHTSHRKNRSSCVACAQ